MLLRTAHGPRRGAYAVEFAIVSQLLFFFLVAHIMGAWMVFQYINTVNVAREGARWASVHGYQWQQDQVAAGKTQAATTATDVFNSGMQPMCVTFDTTNVNGSGPMSYTVTWANSGQQPVYYDSTNSVWKTNTVTVVVNYKWSPIVQGLIKVGPTTMSSTSTVAMQY